MKSMRAHNHGDKAVRAPEMTILEQFPCAFCDVLGRTHNGGRNTDRQEAEDVALSRLSASLSAQKLDSI